MSDPVAGARYFLGTDQGKSAWLYPGLETLPAMVAVDPPTSTIARDPSWLRPGEDVLDNKPAGVTVRPITDFSSSREIFDALRAADNTAGWAGYVKLGPGVYDATKMYQASDGSWRGFSNTNKRVQGIIGTVGANGELLTKIRVAPGLMNTIPNVHALVNSATKAAPGGTGTPFYFSGTNSTVPFFFSGIIWQGTLQAPFMVYANAAAQGLDTNTNVASPMPWGGLSIWRAIPGSRMQFCKFEGFGFGLTAAPPFETGVVNSNYSDGFTRYRVEIDGRISSEIDPTRPRASGAWMLNKEINFTTTDCYDHHTRQSGNAFNTNTHRTDERIQFTRYVVEAIADESDGWVRDGQNGTGNAIGFNGSNLEGLLGIATYREVEFNITTGNHFNLIIPQKGTTSGSEYVLPGRTILDVQGFTTKDSLTGGLLEVGTGAVVGYPLADAIRANMQAACDMYINIRRIDGFRLQPVKLSVYRQNPTAYTPATHYLLNHF